MAVPTGMLGDHIRDANAGSKTSVCCLAKQRQDTGIFTIARLVNISPGCHGK